MEVCQKSFTGLAPLLHASVFLGFQLYSSLVPEILEKNVFGGRLLSFTVTQWPRKKADLQVPTAVPTANQT